MVPKELAHFEASRLRLKPMAIGRMPPDFLSKAKGPEGHSHCSIRKNTKYTYKKLNNTNQSQSSFSNG